MRPISSEVSLACHITKPQRCLLSYDITRHAIAMSQETMACLKRHRVSYHHAIACHITRYRSMSHTDGAITALATRRTKQTAVSSGPYMSPHTYVTTHLCHQRYMSPYTHVVCVIVRCRGSMSWHTTEYMCRACLMSTPCFMSLSCL